MCTEILRESVRYILCLTTPIDIVLLAVTFTPKKLGIVKFCLLYLNIITAGNFLWLFYSMFKVKSFFIVSQYLKKKTLYLSVNVFSTKVLTGDTIFYVS